MPYDTPKSLPLDLDAARQLRAEGQSYETIAKTLGTNFSKVYRALNGTSTPPTMVDASPPVPTTTQKIPLADLCLTAGTQMRASYDLATIAEYAEAMSDGATFPPIIVFSDGTTHWLADGFQRVKAAEHVGYRDISADIRPGTLRDAILYACGANSQHGLRRTNADKRKSVRTLLDDAEWTSFSDRRIAEICGVTHPFVAEMRHPTVKETRQPSTQVVTVTTSTNHEDETSTSPSLEEHATGEEHEPPSEPPSHELPFEEMPSVMVTRADEGFTTYGPPEPPLGLEISSRLLVRVFTYTRAQGFDKWNILDHLLTIAFAAIDAQDPGEVRHG